MQGQRNLHGKVKYLCEKGCKQDVAMFLQKRCSAFVVNWSPHPVCYVLRGCFAAMERCPVVATSTSRRHTS